MKTDQLTTTKGTKKKTPSQNSNFSGFTPGDCTVYDKCTLIKLTREQSQKIINERDKTIEKQKLDISLYNMAIETSKDTLEIMNDVARRQTKSMADQTGELAHLRKMNASLLAVKPEGFEPPPSWWDIQRADERIKEAIKEKDITIARLCSDLSKANEMLRKSTSTKNINYN